jgi:hypothetical protein
MKKVYAFSTLALFLLTAMGLSAQSSSWSGYKDLDKVKIEQKVTSCTNPNTQDSFEYTFLKLTNKTAQPIQVTFRIESYFNGNCTTCSNDEYVFTFNVPANSSIEPSGCAFTSQNDRLAIFRKNLNKPNYSVFDRFELSGIIVQ